MRALLLKVGEGAQLKILGPYSPDSARGIYADFVVLLGDSSLLEKGEVEVYRECVNHKPDKERRVLTLSDLLLHHPGLSGPLFLHTKDLGCP